MTLDPAWLAHPRPNGGILEVIGVRCVRCHRRMYVIAAEGERERCIGCDEIAAWCYCPAVPRPEAVP